MSMVITPQILDGVTEWMREQGYDCRAVGFAANRLRETWTEDLRPIQHNDIVIVTEGQFKGSVGHAVVHTIGDETTIRVRIHGYPVSYFVPEGALQRLVF
jgi:hypothetical protein